MNVFLSISKLLKTGRAADHPVAFSAGSLVSWTQFQDDTSRLAYRLQATGGKCWLIATDDAYALAVALLAVLHSGGRALLPANLQPGHLGELAGSADGTLLHPLPSLGFDAGSPILTERGDYAPWQFNDLDAGASVIQLHTSGTTGKPEPVMKPLRCLEAEIAVFERLFGSQRATSVLATVPAFHIYGLLFRVLWPLAAGRPFDAGAVTFPEELMIQVAQRPGSLLVSSPAFLRRALPLLNLDVLSRSLSGAFSSGGPLEPEVAATYNERLNCGVVEVYGSTETGGVAHRLVREANNPPPWSPMPGVTITLTEGEGRLAVLSPFLTSPTPFVTGDCGVLLPEGGFRLTGRKDRIIKLEERRVSLLELEERLKACPEIKEARITVLWTPGGRASLGAVVVPSEVGWQAIAEGGKRELRRHLHAHLKPHVEALALPRRWRFVRRFPQTTHGKVTAESLAALFLPAGGKVVEPVVGLVNVRQQRAEIALRPQGGLAYFDGHFDTAPILPGVVQVEWAIKQARRCFSMPESFYRIEALKFFQVLPAETPVQLILEFDSEKARLTFSYEAGSTVHSSGHIRFEVEP